MGTPQTDYDSFKILKWEHQNPKKNSTGRFTLEIGKENSFK